MSSEKAKVIFKKQRLIENETGCQFCHWGKAGDIVWRIEFDGPGLGFHWLCCNKCRYNIFEAFAGKRIDKIVKHIPAWCQNILVTEPKQKLSSKGKVRSSRYFALSWDRRDALDRGYTIRQYEDIMRKKANKKKKKRK